MRLHLIRHPKPSIEAGICYGRLDIPAKIETSLVERLRASLPPDLPVWTSPLGRCRLLAERLHPRPIVDSRLTEIDFGHWEGQAWDAIPRTELDAWAADVAGYAPPGGESPRALQHRALDFVGTLAVPEAILVTHGGVIRTLLAHWRALPPERWCDITIGYGECTTIDLGALSGGNV